MGMVMQTVNGQQIDSTYTTTEFKNEFCENVVDYSVKYPPGRPVVDAKHFEFQGIDQERKYFTDNWETYYEQFEPGSPPISQQDLQNFTVDDYAAFKQRFAIQAQNCVAETDDLTPLSPAHLVKDMCTANSSSTPPKLYPDE